MSLFYSYELYPFDLQAINFKNNQRFELNESIFLDDVAFFIPVKIDSEERLRNLKRAVENLNFFFKNPIHILESSKESFVDFEGNYIKHFTFASDDKFLRAKTTNSFIKNCKEKFIFCLESDVLIDPKAVIECYNKLQTGEFDFTMPFNGVDAFLSKMLSENFDPRQAVPNLWKYYYNIDKSMIQNDYVLHNDFKHVGFSYFFNKEKFIECGMENEHFNTWGYDDIERFHRLSILGYKFFYSDYFCYHLWHPRNMNPSYYDKNETSKNTLSLYQNYSKADYLNLIKSWN